MLTVLTPTYDRVRTLPRLYDSLCRQEGIAFEWLVVDDGSHDDTAALIVSLAARSAFPVRYLSQPNGGKHVALNLGVSQAGGDWVFVVDSDDWLPDNALQVVWAALRDVADDPGVAGVCFRKTDARGYLLGRPRTDLPVPWVATPSQAGHCVGGELAYVCRRQCMAAVPFPVIVGEKFVPDQYLWNRVADQGKLLFYLDRAVYCCEYLEDGYTRNFSTHLRQNPRGFFLFYAEQVWREPSLVGKLKAVVRCAQCLLYRVMRGVRRDAAGG
jgi:glycosyltransferase involved in cell wall biosynthesis